MLKRRVLVSLEIPSRDHSYSWVMQWLVARQSSGFGGGWHHRGVQTTYQKDDSGRVLASFDFVPSPGRHWLHLGGFNFLRIERDRETKVVDLTTGSPWETLTLTTLSWPFGQKLFSQILEDAKEAAMEKEEGKTVIYNPAGHEWRSFGDPKQIRPFGSVILHESTSEKILVDVQDFLMSQSWYLERGIPYRRGYLLYGPPGCGKSSYVLALSGRLRYNICVLNLGDPAMTDDRMQHLLAVSPPRSIILIEDIDQAATTRAEIQDGPYAGVTRVTFSGLLNALDGVTATEERLVFMTTNKYSTLPQSLIRPGRIDLRVYIGMASRNQLGRMFRRFYPDATLELEEQFCDNWGSTPISMAELQGYFLFFKDAPEKSVESVGAYIDQTRKENADMTKPQEMSMECGK